MVWSAVVTLKRRCFNAFCNDHYHHSRGRGGRKLIPALAFNFIIAVTNAWRGKWNGPSIQFFSHRCHFFYLLWKMQKMKTALWGSSGGHHYKVVGQNNVGISKNWNTRGRLQYSLPRVKPGRSFVCQPYASSWGAPRVVEVEITWP